MKHRVPTPFTDNDGTACVRVALSNHPEPWVTTAAAYEHLIAAGMSGTFWLGYGARRIGYVTGKLPRYGGHPIARLIAQAGPRQQVTYCDGNRLNLRPDNLAIEPCRNARAHTAVLLEIAQAAIGANHPHATAACEVM